MVESSERGGGATLHIGLCHGEREIVVGYCKMGDGLYSTVSKEVGNYFDPPLIGKTNHVITNAQRNDPLSTFLREDQLPKTLRQGLSQVPNG